MSLIVSTLGGRRGQQVLAIQLIHTHTLTHTYGVLSRSKSKAIFRVTSNGFCPHLGSLLPSLLPSPLYLSRSHVVCITLYDAAITDMRLTP